MKDHDHGGAVIRAVGLAGSLRASYNRLLLDNAIRLAPDTLDIVAFDRIGEIPPFNEDLAAGGDPPAVAALRASITGSDALVIATPEYNYGVPGVPRTRWTGCPSRRADRAWKVAWSR